ncbi:MAG: hypothetical protein JWQ71_3753 [Pedosphaera sp.]|nr:hypothetical protein [Pedosphaera sp.]
MQNHFLGNNPVRSGAESVAGRQVVLDGEEFYCISNCGPMRPFFLSIVSSADHWMFISSNGALTAGRCHPDLALFPYYTDDKIHDAVEITGPKTIFIVERGGKKYLWEPFSERGRGIYWAKRNLYKNFPGNKIIFEEINDDLGLTFRYGWASSEQFGWVRQSSLASSAAGVVKVRLVDGIQNLLPCGIGSQFQLEKSTLIDAYKKNELLPESGLGLFLLSSIPVDRPEPSESLRATTVWSAGIPRRNVLLSSVQLEKFRQGLPLKTEIDVRAERGAYFVNSEFSLRSGQSRQWIIVSDVDQGPSQVANLRKLLRSPVRLQKKVEADIAQGTQELWRIVARADGLQKSARPLGDARHFNNVLFNVMRGGVFFDGYQIDAADLFSFVRHANSSVASRHGRLFRKLGKTASRARVLELARESADANLERLCQEYLPLTFSRRHGDPSRPWNRFSITTRGADGRRVLNYEGNWRDIFQNWEALAVSFPGFVSGMVCKFVNASTADGYNPYRITRDGFDWEVHDPHDPWSHIGYWGDHQIIYLLKLLEILQRHEPAVLCNFLARDIFAFANVPYKIKPYAQLLENPRDTVDFDSALDQLTRQRVGEIGADGKLVWDKSNCVRHVNLTEKLLIPLLAKFSSFIPGAGIWLNTQRPEWNDANNALVGNGVSMGTLYQLRRHLAFCRELFLPLKASEVQLSAEVADWFSATLEILKRYRSAKIGDAERRKMLDALGRVAGNYRQQIYVDGFSGSKMAATKDQLLEFFRVALTLTDESIRVNQRADGLYHSYNLVELGDRTGIPVRRLPEMLEGQAAILGANVLTAKESLDLLTALKRSPVYRANQKSYLLYPDRSLPRFVEKNNLPAASVARLQLLKRLLADGNRLLVERDVSGVCHFQPRITNAGDVKAILKQLAVSGYASLVKRESAQVLELFEKMFDHRSFTGRSGNFFGYEGLGCIYWHMVSKLLLATQESFFRADATPFAGRLAACYHDIRTGIGDFKTPENYGAFPMDPYSHTPAHTGARQPGLTGQVKEDILCRFGELGLSVREGRIHFAPQLLRPEEFLQCAATFTYLDVGGRVGKLRLKPGALAFTYCQVPMVYQLTENPFLTIEFTDGKKHRQVVLSLDEKISRAIFERTGAIKSIICGLSSARIAKSTVAERLGEKTKPS